MSTVDPPRLLETVEHVAWGVEHLPGRTPVLLLDANARYEQIADTEVVQG